MTPLEHNQLLSVLNTNGFHAEVRTLEDWVAADATFAPGRCYVTALRQSEEYLAATSLPEVADALAGEGFELERSCATPPGAARGAFPVSGPGAFHRLVRRIYQLSLALPTAPFDTFAAKARAMPASTDAERLVIQRVGQDIFRNALLDYWDSRCPLTGITDRDLLRASHIVGWAECDGDEHRLDVHNGLLLSALWDAAFDRGLVSFTDDGAPMAGPGLSDLARKVLGLHSGLRIAGLRDAHRGNLRRHRAKYGFPTEVRSSDIESK
ncbi:MAG TPA: HNH endonuclease [Rhizomicrobium sp.]|jgi:hypothetical protein|nr:HNH endonuclease [Rhizomicrobium sp.]